MTSHHPRRDDRSAADPLKHWDSRYPPDHRRNRSATLPAHAYDARPYPSHDPRQSARPRQDPHYHAAPSYHPQAPTSKAYQHATRPSAHPPAPVASSSRRQHTDPPSRRPSAPVHHDQVPVSEEAPRTSRHPSRVVHSSAHPSLSAPPNQASWSTPRDIASSRRPKDPYRDRERDQERERDRDRDRENRERDRDRDRPPADPESRYRDRTKTDRHRERDRERTAETRYQESSRSRHHDRRKDPDAEGALYAEQRNASKASLSGREGNPSVREVSHSHRRHRTEDGTASTGRRYQPENTQNPITTMPSQSTNVPQPDMQQTGEPPPAPLVMPVHLPPKVKSQRSHMESRPSTAQGAQSGSDTERATSKYRMERTPSGPLVHRSDAHTSGSTRDRSNHDIAAGQGKHGLHQDHRQPLAPINVDIPLVTPGFNSSALPNETRASTVPQIVSIRAGQGPSDPHDAHFKSLAISHLDAPQETIHPHPTSASIVKPSGHIRSQSSETRVQPDRLEHSRVEPRGDDLSSGQHMSIHESGRALPPQISKSHSYTRGNPETGDYSYPYSRPPSRSAHRASANNVVPPPVIGPRPARSVSQGPQTNDPPTRPPSGAQYAQTMPVLNQHPVPPSPSHPTSGSSPRTGHVHGFSSPAQPSPKNAQLHGVSPSHSTSTQHGTSAPSVHPTPSIVPQTLTTSSRPSTRDGVSSSLQQPADQRPTMDDRPGSQQTPNSMSVRASWVVQTPASAKRAKISREEKYMRDHVNSDTPRAQLRQVLSQDDHSFPRASSSMMKASQATTPSATSHRSSPGTMMGRDVSFGTPRGTLAGNSPRSEAIREATPEQVLRQTLSPQLAGPPQIAIVGATPDSLARDLPQDGVDHAFLAPPFPAPPLVSRTISGSQEQQKPTVRDTPSFPYQPQLAPAHAPSLFQPYCPLSPPSEDNGQFSPPPLPIPPPKGLEDSPPPTIETRANEIIPMRSQTDGHPHSHVNTIPQVESEMFHIPSQPLSAMPLRTSQAWQSTSVVPTSTPNGMARGDAESSKEAFVPPNNVRVAHQDIMGAIPVLPSQPSDPPIRSRPKVTVEDAPDDSPVLSKAIPSNVHTMPSSAPLSKSQPSFYTETDHASQSSPQSKPKDPSLHRSADPSAVHIPPYMPPPITAAAPTLTRMPSSAPPIYSTFTQPAPSQRAAPYAAPSRTHQRAAEMLQTSKLTTNPGVGNVNKTVTTPVQTTQNPVTAVIGQLQQANGAGIQVSRPVYASTTAPQHIASVIASTSKTAAHAMSGSGPPVGALGVHIPASTSVTQPPPAPDTLKQQPGRPGTSSMPSVDDTSTTVMPTPVAKNPHQEQSIVDATRPRDITPFTSRNFTPSSQTSTMPARPGTSTTTLQQTHVTPVQPQSYHHRVVSLPVASSSSATQRPASPRKYSQPVPSATVSTQPFPSRSSVPESQSVRAPIPGHVLATASGRSMRPPPPDRTHDSDVLKTPSSIAPSPMLNPDTVHAMPQPIAVPIRTRQPSTDSKDEKKKPSGLFGLFRARTLSSKAADAPTASTATRTSTDHGRVHPDTSVVAPTATSMPRAATSASIQKEWNPAAPPATSASTRAGPQSKPRVRVPNPIAIPPPPTQAAREQKDTTPHIFTPFKFLHSKRNRTVSAASLDVCDGNTATNTVIGSPDHSAISQAQPLPHIILPDFRDPLVATSEWRDKEEAQRRERRAHVRRPGVTFDLEEEPPSPAPGTVNKRKKLVRRPTGRAPTPGPPRG